mgnify:CR=1 FL=1
MQEAKGGDRRVRKTRRVLRQELVRLMERKSVQDITVKELCAACDLNRGTFYAHYTDIYQLLASIEAEMLAEFEQVLGGLAVPPAQQVKMWQGAQPSPALCALFRFLADNEDMCRVLLCNNGDMAFVEQVKQLVRQRVMDGEHIEALGGAERGEYVYSFVVSGCVGLLQYWLGQGTPLSPDEMAAMVQGILAKGVAALM